MQFLGSINNQDILANVCAYRSYQDGPNKFRWCLLCYLYDKTKNGESIEGLDNSRGDGFHIFPNPYELGDKDFCINKAISFLNKLGFKEFVDGKV